MIKLKRPKSQLFEDMLDEGDPTPIRYAFEVYLTPTDILSFVTNKHIIFLSEEEISKCFKIFSVSQGEDWLTEAKEEDWSDQHSEAFALRVKKEMGIKNNPLWFSPLIDEGFHNFVEEQLG